MSSSLGSADQALRQNFCSTPIKLTSSGTHSRTVGALAKGRYRIVTDEPVYIKQGGSSVEATSSDGSLLPAGAIDFLTVDKSSSDNATPNDYVSIIAVSAAASFELLLQRG